jgi:glycosyltransferase involved in cell wall biosynthesis
MQHCGMVSVVIPVFNGAPFLAQAIQSVLDQTYPLIEVIAVDDGSIDESLEILQGFGNHIQIIAQPNSGVAAARNAGIAKAVGEFIAFLDQDDYWNREKVARQVEKFAASTQVGLVHTGVSYFDATIRNFVSPENPSSRPEQMVGDCYELLLMGNPLCNSSVIVRRKFINMVGPCNLKIRGNTVQDYDLWLRLARVSQFDYVNEPLTVFRLHEDQGHRDRRAMLCEELKLLLRHRAADEWRSHSDRRLRLAGIYDGLATAHMDSREPAIARHYFWKAFLARPSMREALRYTASCFPYGFVQYIRRQRERSTRSCPATNTPPSTTTSGT